MNNYEKETKKISILLFIAVIFVCLSNPTHAKVLTVHVVPHSHCDPGWWWTFEEYHEKWTKGIISSVIDSLLEDERRTFIWAEISFFERWWVNQNPSKKQKVIDLVESGRLEFVNGGWVAPDEANTYYEDLISQMTQGHQWLYDTLGVKPSKGWSIDAFGHSSTIPYLLSQMGFNGTVINRVHDKTKREFREKKNLEFVWRQNWQYKQDPKNANSLDLFTHMLAYPLYDIPNTCGPDWHMCEGFDFERPVATAITASNVAARSRDLINQYKQKASNFIHNHVLIPLGDDFKYKTLDMTNKIFNSYQMLFDHINSDKSLGVQIQFSTLSQYFAGVQEDQANADIAFPTYFGDFFTYLDKDSDYWSGYFTTRPYAKGLSRKLTSLIRSANALCGLIVANKLSPTSTLSSFLSNIEEANRILSLFQHHDGITGTSRVAVVQAYIHSLEQSIDKIRQVIKDVSTLYLEKCLSSNKITLDLPLDHKTRNNLHLENGQGTITVFNSLGQPRSELVEIYLSVKELNTKYINILDANGNEVDVQIQPVWDSPGEPSKEVVSCLFFATLLPLELKAYSLTVSSSSPNSITVTTFSQITRSTSLSILGMKFKSENFGTEEITIENDHLRVRFDPGTGLIKAVEFLSLSHVIELEQDFLTYSSSGSGAYLFVPAQSSANPISIPSPTLHLIKGSLLQELYVVGSGKHDAVSYRVRLFGGSSPASLQEFVEVNHKVDLTDYTHSNHELITRYKTNMKNNDIFFTDSNGIDMQKRKYNPHEPIQANYYPITSMAAISDSKIGFSVLTGQALGAGSSSSGCLEIMLDRKLSRDDGRGLGEGVTDNKPTDIKFWLSFQQLSQNKETFPYSSQTQQQSLLLNNPLQIMYGGESSTHTTKIAKTQNPTNNFHLISLRPRSTSSEEVVIQLYNYSPQDFAIVDLSIMPFEIAELDKYSLSLLHRQEDVDDRRVAFKTDPKKTLYQLEAPSEFQIGTAPKPSSSLEVVLAPKQIQTFVVSTRKMEKNQNQQRPVVGAKDEGKEENNGREEETNEIPTPPKKFKGQNSVMLESEQQKELNEQDSGNVDNQQTFKTKSKQPEKTRHKLTKAPKVPIPDPQKPGLSPAPLTPVKPEQSRYSRITYLYILTSITFGFGCFCVVLRKRTRKRIMKFFGVNCF